MAIKVHDYAVHGGQFHITLCPSYPEEPLAPDTDGCACPTPDQHRTYSWPQRAPVSPPDHPVADAASEIRTAEQWRSDCLREAKLLMAHEFGLHHPDLVHPDPTGLAPLPRGA